MACCVGVESIGGSVMKKDHICKTYIKDVTKRMIPVMVAHRLRFYPLAITFIFGVTVGSIIRGLL